MNEEILKELKEIKELLQVIASNQKQNINLKIEPKKISDSVVESIHDKLRPY